MEAVTADRPLHSGPPPSIELADGTIVELRPMAADDAAALRRFHETLSRETTYLRFFAIHPDLSTREVDRFTHVDHRDREALTAAVGSEIVGVARFDRLADGGEDAEVAFVVADGWQGRGLGSALFRVLADQAREVGVRTLVADTLPVNSRMLAVFHHSGLPVASTFEDGVVHLRIALEPAPSGESTSPAS